MPVQIRAVVLCFTHVRVVCGAVDWRGYGAKSTHTPPPYSSLLVSDSRMIARPVTATVRITRQSIWHPFLFEVAPENGRKCRIFGVKQADFHPYKGEPNLFTYSTTGRGFLSGGGADISHQMKRRITKGNHRSNTEALVLCDSCVRLPPSSAKRSSCSDTGPSGSLLALSVQ